MAGGQDEPVAIGPRRIGRVMAEEARPQDVRHRRGAHRQTGMAGLRVLHGVGRQEPDRVDAELVEIAIRHDAALLSPVMCGTSRS